MTASKYRIYASAPEPVTVDGRLALWLVLRQLRNAGCSATVYEGESRLFRVCRDGMPRHGHTSRRLRTTTQPRHRPGRAPMDPAYDLTTVESAERYLRDHSFCVRQHPAGHQHVYAGWVTSIAELTRWPGDRVPAGDEALAALTLVADLRDWLTEAEPRLIAAARAQGVTWQQLAGVLRVGGRGAAQRRAARLARSVGRYWL
jgi:hypothetical protein